MGKKPVLVLGASGQLGRLFYRLWPAHSGLWQFRRPPEVAQAGQLVFDLLSQPEALLAAARRSRAILCLAGPVPGRERPGEDLRLHTPLALAAVEAGAQAGVPVLLASSAAIYGAAEIPLREDSPLDPQNAYGRAKQHMEQAALSRAHVLGARVSCLRIGNIAGSDAILKGWKPGFVLDQFTDGTTPARSYIGPKTLAQSLFSLCDHSDLPETLNIATPQVVQMGALLDAAGLAWTPRPAPVGAIARVELDVSRLMHILPLAPEAGVPQRLVEEWQQTKAD